MKSQCMRRVRSALISAALVSMALLLGCSSASSKPTLYKMAGMVVSVDPASHQATISHDAIPGFMEAMTMPYPVKDDAELRKLSSGDQIKADLMVNKETGEIWLASIQVTQPALKKAKP